MSKVIVGNGGFYSCLSGPQGASVWWKEIAEIRVFLLPPSLLLNHFNPQSSKAERLLPVIPLSIVGYAFTLWWTTFLKKVVSVFEQAGILHLC